MNIADWVRERREWNQVVADAEERKRADDARRADKNWRTFIAALEPILGESYGGRTIRDSFYCWDAKTMRSGNEGMGHRGAGESLIVGDAHYDRDAKGIAVSDRYSRGVVGVNRALQLLAEQIADARPWVNLTDGERGW